MKREAINIPLSCVFPLVIAVAIMKREAINIIYVRVL